MRVGYCPHSVPTDVFIGYITLYIIDKSPNTTDIVSKEEAV